jgi:predicted acetyltransferase
MSRSSLASSAVRKSPALVTIPPSTSIRMDPSMDGDSDLGPPSRVCRSVSVRRMASTGARITHPEPVLRDTPRLFSMPLLLRPFEAGDEAAALAANDAFIAEGFTFLLGYTDGMSWFEWIQENERIRAGVDLPPERVRAAFLAAIVDEQLVGRVSIRFELNEWLAREGGHIGYGVLHTFRRQGYATAILRQAVDLGHKEGVHRLLVICDEVNAGSATVIERCGGVLEDQATAEDGTPIRRYWI